MTLNALDQNDEREHGTDSVFEGRSVDDAIELGLTTLNLLREEAEVAVLDRGSRGFLGLGARRAKVKVGPKRQKIASTVRAMTGEILRLMEIDAWVTAHQMGRDVRVRIESGKSDGLLIGRKGETLNAFEHILNRMAARQTGLGAAARIEVDVAGYRGRREDQVRRTAIELAERAERTGRRAMTEPLGPAERRIVHEALADNRRVQTHATGNGPERRLVITPARGGTQRSPSSR
jgi:spoIIIJ-associated protein